ncbi:MAG TPA: nucleoside deaminase [Alphaproteobacteria bacterium]|nr:nucleoside deaminase [Alphaproteobacteria bacterium]
MDQKQIMKRVIELSQRGMLGGFGGPFGSVIVKDGQIVGEGHNEVLATNDPTAHAEVLAIRRASAKLKSFDLSGCEIYINGTPCCMCMASMLWARIARAYYILTEDDSASIGLGDQHLYEEISRPLKQRRIIPMVHLPELRNEALAVYALWQAKPDKVSY